MSLLLRVGTLFFAIGVFVSLWLTRSHTLTPVNQETRKLKIVCTTSIIADALRTIAQDTIDLYCLMGPGIDPHLYRPTQGDMRILSQADLIIYNGLHLEGKMADLLAAMQKKKPTYAVCDALDKATLLKAYDAALFDPHIWHNVHLWTSVVRHLNTILQQHAPEHATFYEENSKKYIITLEKLHAYVILEIQKIPEKQRILVTAHDAFRYFGKAYGIHVEGLQGTSTNAEISTHDMQKLTSFIVEKKIKALFVESSVPYRSIQALQQAVRARGWNVNIGPDLYSDALADNNNESTYCDMIKHNTDAIVTALR